MKLSKLIPTREQLNFVQGIEGSLLKRQRLEVMSAIVAVMGGSLQVLISAIENFEVTSIISAIAGFGLFVFDLVSLDFGNLQNYEPVYELAGIAILAGSIGFYLLLKRTKFLLKESEEPFRYTFWVNQFNEVQGNSEESNKKFKDTLLSDFLHLDLTERLSERVGRLSLLDETNLDKQTKENLNSHIYIEGDFALRQNRDHQWIVQVISRIRIGSPSQPSNLTYAINYPLGHDYQPLESDGSQPELSVNDYEDIVERVYSSVATEIYKQIKADLEDKISMFPTKYRRAVALFHEATDFARSNTVDAYDHAIELYREAIRYFNISLRTKIQLIILRLPLLWRLSIRFHHNWARTVIEYSKCLIYRRMLSTLSGRLANPLFEIPDELSKVIERLNKIHQKMTDVHSIARELPTDPSDNKDGSYRYKATVAHLIFKRDSLGRNLLLKTGESTFTRQKEILFEANITAAMAYCEMDAIKRAKMYLKNAKAVAPSYCKENVLFDLTAGMLEPDIEEKTTLLRHATEKAPNFEIAQFIFSKNLERLLRTQNQIDKERAKQVIAQYDEVTKINPGNIAALNSQGYLNWLINNLEEAEKKFLRGLEVKSIVQHTFIGELSYGLARITAQRGNFNRCYDYFEEAISSEPSVGAYSEFNSSKTITSYYSYIGPTMKKCFARYKQQVEQKIEAITYGFCIADILDPEGIIAALVNPADETLPAYLAKKLSPKLREVLQSNEDDISLSDQAQILAREFTNLITEEDFLNEPWISSIKLNRSIRKLLKQRQNGASSYVYQNRMIIEQIFPDRIRKYSEKASSGRPFTDAEGKPLTETTIDIVHSFVLNDYANALLNYYHRFGSKHHIEEAIKLYNQAKQKNPSYKVVYLNLDNAYSWQNNQTKARECLQEGEKYFTSWVEGQMALLKSKAENIQRRINDLTRKIEEKEAKVSSSEKTKTRMSVTPEEKHDSIEPYELKTTDLAKNASKSISKKEIKELENKLAVEKRKRRNQIFPKLETIMAQSNLGSLFENLKIDHHGNGVNQLYQYRSKIGKDKLDENDIDALQIWAKVLSYNTENKNALLAAQKLCELIKYYYPDHFDATLILHDIFFSLNKDEDIPFLLKKEELKNPRTFLKSLKSGTDPFSRLLLEYRHSDQKPAAVVDEISEEMPHFEDNLEELQETLVHAVNNFIEDGQHIDWKHNTDQLSQRTRHLFRFDLTGRDLMGLKRRLVEDLYPESIQPKSIKTYREEIRNNIEFWIKQKDKTYVSLRWALSYSTFTFPEYEDYVEDVTLKLGVHGTNLINKESLFDAIANQYQLWQDWENAETAYSKAQKINPANAKYYNQIGIIYYRKDKYEEAAKYFEEAINRNPDKAIYHENLGDACQEMAEWDKAEKAFEQALKINPEGAEYINKIGLIYYRQNDYNKAIEFFESASKIRQDEPLYLDNMGDAYRELGELEQAKTAYQKAKEIDPDNPAYNNKIGILYYRKDDYQKALDYFKKAVRQNASDPVYFANIGDSYIGLIQYKKAITAFNNALKLDPKNAEYSNKLGISYFRIGEYAKAVEHFEYAYEKDPNTILYLENIGDSYIEMQEWNKAEEAFQKAIAHNPSNDYSTNKIGIVRYRQKRFHQAIEYFTKAYEINPNAPVYLNNIGDAHKELGNVDQAEEFFQQAFQIDNTRKESET